MGQLDMSMYLKKLKIRYFKANRKGKSQILEEYCRTSGRHRKHIIRLLNGPPLARKDAPISRKKKYESSRLLEPLKHIWLATDQMCSTRLKAAIPLWLPYFVRLKELEEEVKTQLLTMSERTIDRLLKPVRSKYPRRIGGTKPGSLLRKQIPIKTDQWTEDRPGFVEADTVAHCGTSLMGNFIWSLTLTDIYSGWTENAAVWNKGAAGVLAQIGQIEINLPFKILGFDSDNGGEFLNHHLMKYLQERGEPIQFTRSRPYHKGDNAHVEQKNWTHVRQLFGYYRLENAGLVELMNDLYQNELSLLHNYFYPSIKLKDKERIQSKIKKKYFPPQTPYQRLQASEYLNDLEKQKLKNIFNSLDPFELQKMIQKKLKRIFSQVDLHLRKKTSSF